MFQSVTRAQKRLRIALEGPAGSGKTFTALRFAAGIVAREGGKIALVDTEHGSATLYAGISPAAGESPLTWDQVSLEHFAPSTYTAVIKAAGERGYKVLVIDSLSHAWSGVGGALDQVDRHRTSQGKANSFDAWRTVSPQNHEMVEAILASPCHVIVTLRQKVEYLVEKDEATGKTKIEKVGMKPIQREGVDYEFDIVLDLDLDHTVRVSKTRFVVLDGKIASKPGFELIAPALDFLKAAPGGGATTSPPVVFSPPAAPPAATAAASTSSATEITASYSPERISSALIQQLKTLAQRVGYTPERLRDRLAGLGASRLSDLTVAAAEALLNELETGDFDKQGAAFF